MILREPDSTGPYWDIVTALSPDQEETIRFGVQYDTVKSVVREKLSTVVAQYYGIVQEGLQNASHLFRGLKRPLFHEGDSEADGSVLIYSWRPKVDYVWAGSPYNGTPRPKSQVPGRVFVVLVRKTDQAEYNVVGNIEHWNWVEEDSKLENAPVDWPDRYIEKLWSREL